MSTDFSPIKVSIGPGILYKGRFEYRTETRPRSVMNSENAMVGDELVAWLNGLGASGWALCAVKEDSYGWSEFMFMRELL